MSNTIEGIYYSQALDIFIHVYRPNGEFSKSMFCFEDKNLKLYTRFPEKNLANLEATLLEELKLEDVYGEEA